MNDDTLNAAVRWSDGQRLTLTATRLRPHTLGLAVGQIPQGRWGGYDCGALWTVFDLDTAWPIAYGEDRDNAIFEAGCRLATLATDRGLSIPGLLSQAREHRHRDCNPCHLDEKPSR